MSPTLSRFQVLFMVVTCAFVVGNLYYNQPLLGVLARDFDVTEKQISLVPALTLIGYALGILLLVPLGDRLERRQLLQGGMLAAGLCALGIAGAPHFYVLCILSFVMGFVNISATVLIPFSANLARPEERGKVVGTVLSGILLGSLAARTVAGFMSDLWGWSSVFIFAGGMNVTLALATQWALPASAPSFHGSYKQLLQSLGSLVRDHKIVREAAVMGGLLFGSFSAFWTTLTFLLESDPFNYAAKVIGLFGLLGMMGALAAPLVGRYADKKGPAAAIRLGLYLTLLAFGILGFSSTTVAGIIVGVIILDLGIQVAHISNQTRLFEVSAEARSRLSSIYIFSYFAGGSLGSFLGSQLWSWGRWPAVCAGGFLLCLGAGFMFYRGQRVRLNFASH